MKTFTFLLLLSLNIFSLTNNEVQQLETFWADLIKSSIVHDSVPKEFQINLDVFMCKKNEKSILVDENWGKIYSNRIRLQGKDHKIYKVVTGFYRNKYTCILISDIGSTYIYECTDKTIIDLSENVKSILTNFIASKIKWIIYTIEDDSELYVF
jgi:hypothetical protein